MSLNPRSYLRQQTADLHHAIDRSLAGVDLSDRDTYAAFLEMHARAVVPLEHMLEAAGAAQLLHDWADRRRTPSLLEDLADLDVRPPGPLDVPPISGRAPVLGALYVLEGSRLGGQLLARRALVSPDPRVRRATRYLQHGAERAFWRTFVDYLNRETDWSDRSNLRDGALLAFAVFERAMSARSLEAQCLRQKTGCSRPRSAL